MRGKCAVVTGGSRGIGEAIVLRLAQAGASVVFTARGKEGLDRVQAKVAAYGHTAHAMQADASSLEDCRRVTETAVARFGGVDILVNNAAVFPPSLSVEVTETLWDKTMGVDLKGAFFLSQLAAQDMVKRGHGGRIINVLSTEIIRPTGALVAYCAAQRDSIDGQGARQRQDPRQRRNSWLHHDGRAHRGDEVEWGPVGADEIPPDTAKTRALLQGQMAHVNMAQALTAMLPMGRPGYPDELAKGVLFLASDMASYVNGTTLLVDGAQTLR